MSEDGDYEVVIARVPRFQPVTWAAGSYEPEDALWLTDDEFQSIAWRSQALKGIDYYGQNRFDTAAIREIAAELTEARDSEIATRVIALCMRCVDGGANDQMIVEGP